MTGLGIFLVMGLYAALCVWVLKFFMRWVKPNWLKWVLGIALFPLLYAAPLADEIIGNYQFKKYCKEAEEIKIYGTIPVGEELYFPDGRWRLEGRVGTMPSDELRSVRQNIDALLEHRSSPDRRVPAVIPIWKSDTTVLAKKTGAPLASYSMYWTEGGWLSREHGMEKPYVIKNEQCVPSLHTERLLPFNKRLRGQE